MAKIPLEIYSLIRIVISALKYNQLMLVTHSTPPKYSPKFVNNFSSYPVDRPTDGQANTYIENITSLEDVINSQVGFIIVDYSINRLIYTLIFA